LNYIDYRALHGRTIVNYELEKKLLQPILRQICDCLNKKQSC